MKRFLVALLLAFPIALIAGEVTVTSVTAQQRYPWNGLVDIVVTFNCESNELNNLGCSFVATNCATGAAVPVTGVIQRGADAGSGTTWTRRYIWNASDDVGNVKIDDLALTVDVRVLGGVQLWENGPYWAECNVGATKPEEYGYYFWWGDTVGYKRNADNNGWVSVKDGTSFSFSSGNCPTYDKSNAQLQSAGYTDSAGNLVAARDAATAHLGEPWRMPTDAEFSALISNCDTTWTTRGGVCGRLVTGRGAYASKSVFLPAVGYGYDSGLYETGSYGSYWSSTPDSDSSGDVWILGFYSGDFCRYDYCRDNGRPVRPLQGFADNVSGAVMTHLKLDSRAGVRECSADGDVLRFDVSWFENGDEVRITDNGMVVTNGTAGWCAWRPIDDSSAPHLLQMDVLRAGEVIATETAQFGLGYIRNVTARQLWPHNKVALEFTLAEDVGKVKSANEELTVWCAHGVLTYEATRIIGDRFATPGVHRIVWDMEADGLRFVNTETEFAVSVDEFKMMGIQLWENGPYWAECNVGASRPEEYGYYFWWGDTVGYKPNADSNGWVSVKDGSRFSFSSGNCSTYGMNDTRLQSAGYIDSAGNLVAAHDAAAAHFGAPWRMPTDSEFSALISNCDTTLTTRGGVYGYLVTGRGEYASKSIFLPAAGSGYNSYVNIDGSYGHYWVATPNPGNSFTYAWSLGFGLSSFDRDFNMSRYCGLSIRPCRDFVK